MFYFVTLLSFVVYVYTPAGDVDWSYKTLALTEELARILLPPLTLHFFLLFPRPILRSKWAFASLYVLPALLALWNIDVLLLGNAVPVASPQRSLELIDRWEMLDFGIYFTLALLALGFTYRTAAAVGKKQIKWIYLGMALGFVPFLAIYIIPYLIKGSVTPVFSTISILPLALIPLAFAVSILKYKLWDVEVVIKEVLAYSVTFVFGIIAFSTVNLILSKVIEEGALMERNFLAFTSGLFIAGVLIPVKGRIESVIEMFLYRESYRHRRTLTDFAQELATFHDVHELIAMMRERLRTTLDIEKMNLFTRDGATLIIYAPETGIPRRASAADFPFLPKEGPLVLTEPRLPDASELPWLLLKAGYRYVFPLRNRGELQGLMLLGTKRGEEPLSRDDLHLLGSLTAPVALAIENSRLYGRLRRQLDEIRALKEYNENIIESSSSAIAVVAGDGTVLTANRAFWELVGAEHEDESIATLFPPFEELRHGSAHDLDQLHEQVRRGEGSHGHRQSAARGRCRRGARVLVIGDISDRVRLERELQQKERLASLGLLAAGRRARSQHAAHRHLVVCAAAAVGNRSGRSEVQAPEENGAADVPRVEPRQQPSRPHRQPSSHARAGQRAGAGARDGHAPRGSPQAQEHLGPPRRDARGAGAWELSRSAAGSHQRHPQRPRRRRPEWQHLDRRRGRRGARRHSHPRRRQRDRGRHDRPHLRTARDHEAGTGWHGSRPGHQPAYRQCQ